MHVLALDLYEVWPAAVEAARQNRDELWAGVGQ